MKRFNNTRFKEIQKQVEEEINTLSLFSLEKLYKELKTMRKPYDPVPKEDIIDNKKLSFIVSWFFFIVALFLIALFIISIISSKEITAKEQEPTIWIYISMLSTFITLVCSINSLHIHYRDRRREKEFRNFVEEDLNNLIQRLKEKHKSVEETLLHEMEEKILSSTNEESGNIQSTIKEWRVNHIKENS